MYTHNFFRTGLELFKRDISPLIIVASLKIFREVALAEGWSLSIKLIHSPHTFSRLSCKTAPIFTMFTQQHF